MYNKNQKGEFNQKLIDLRRVTRVVAGGKRFTFRATVVIGNSKGEVGAGMGKGVDTALSLDKAFRNAKKNLIKVPITKDLSIPHPVEAKFSASRVIIKPARKGRGLIAGSAVRTLLDLAGVKNATAKIISKSKNKINIIKAAILALKKIR